MEHLELEKLSQRIMEAEELQELKSIREQTRTFFSREMDYQDPLQWNRVLNQTHDMLIKRTVMLAEELLMNRGAGAPPVPFSFILFGSGGRGEQTLWSDQDNGIIYEPSAEVDPNAIEEYFHLLVGTVLRGLQEVGYPPCEGNVVCTNSRWLKPRREWKRMIQEWMDEPNWEHVRYLLIFSDGRTVYGDSQLLHTVKEQMLHTLTENRDFPRVLLNNTLHHKVPMNIFGQIIKERYGEDAGGFDIKYGAYIPMVNSIRLLALMHGIGAHSTEERIHELEAVGQLTERMAGAWRTTLAGLLRMRSETPYAIDDGMITTRGKLSASYLQGEENRKRLKSILKSVKRIQKVVRYCILHDAL